MGLLFDDTITERNYFGSRKEQFPLQVYVNTSEIRLIKHSFVGHDYLIIPFEKRGWADNYSACSRTWCRRTSGCISYSSKGNKGKPISEIIINEMLLNHSLQCIVQVSCIMAWTQNYKRYKWSFNYCYDRLDICRVIRCVFLLLFIYFWL